VCSFLRPLYDQQVIDVRHSSVARKTYVFRVSTGRTRSPSILLTHCSRRTTLQILYAVLPKRSSDSSRDPGETAIVERPFAAGHLHIPSVSATKGRGRNNKRFIQRPIPELCPIPPVGAIPSNEQVLKQIFVRNLQKYGTPPITTFEIPWTTPKVCATADSPSSFVNRSNLSRASRILSFPDNIFKNFSVTH
jgi:hypothetical protein